MPPEKKEQINFRVSTRFRKLIEAECIGREMSLQDFITAAVKLYSQTPRGDWRTVDILNVAHDAEGAEESAAGVRLWARYTNTMPEEKIRLIMEVMKLDLLHYRSSRRKAALRKRQQTGKESTRVETRTE